MCTTTTTTTTNNNNNNNNNINSTLNTNSCLALTRICLQQISVYCCLALTRRYVYIYIYIERERCVCICIYIYIYVNSLRVETLGIALLHDGERGVDEDLPRTEI